MPTSSDGERPVLTLLNEPPAFTIAQARELLRRVRYRRGKPRWGGPPSVTRNLTVGLERAGLDYALNPGNQRIRGNVGVLSHIDTLRHAIALKRAGVIRRLVAGPNLVVAPNRSGRILCAPEIDTVVVPSLWVRAMFLDFAPELEPRIVVWPVGVDELAWQPATLPPKKDVLVYTKTELAEVLDAACAALERQGLSFTVLQYGSHTSAQYRSSLHEHRWMLYLSESETQGIALLEAWACGVPTLVWDRGRCLFEDIDCPASSAPYLAPANGISFTNEDELPAAISAMERSAFTPRLFVLEQFTARARAEEYARLFER